MSEIAAFGLSAEPFDPDYHSRSDFEHDMASPTLPRIPLFVPSQYWDYHVHSPVGYHGYPVQQYSSSFEMTPFSLLDPSYDPWQYEYEIAPSNADTFGSATQRFNHDNFLETTGIARSSKLTATAPPFVPIKSSKLNAAAPTFLLSRLAIFDSPADDDLAKRPRKYNRVLPDARNDKITCALEMMQCPRDGQVGRFTDETTYEFNKGWHFNDPVLAEMYHTMNRPKKHNFAAFALRVNIRPVNDAPPLWPPHMNLFDIKSYYFEILEKDSVKQAKWVTILPNGSPPTAETIHIYDTYKKEWVSFGDWLAKIVKSRKWLGRLGDHLQFKWYKSKGSKRRFEDFPAEIREKIYKAALGGEVYPLNSLCTAEEYTCFWPDGEPESEAQLTLGLGYHPGLFMRLKGEALLASPWDENRVPEDRPPVHKPSLSLSAVNSTIREEFLHFAWVRMRSRFFTPDLFVLAIKAWAGPAMAYQHLSKIELNFTNVEWFEFFGEESLEERLTVTLTGAVKTATKEKWEAIFKGQRHHDQEAALKVILDTPDEEL
ncbi:uncharacterized protein J4E84_007044 [Alternaria hordeiaustralica]|uniref:uncharacterized protein n=1 Tax=Alternaria hordeiaustralica TaxID=1187925 RepID=UPI0020C3FB28|nr:uncharacterized protein J4E84_007044 [Alternaria hordeiaustralica]KAI4683141.1 hypothetical protein J4E84_007044 [Alternaria hordeiaustralica]